MRLLAGLIVIPISVLIVVVLFAGCARGLLATTTPKAPTPDRSSASPVVTPTATVASTTPSPTASPAVVASPSPPKLTPPATVIYYSVGNTDGDGVYIRRAPRMEDRIAVWPDGTPMQWLGETVQSEGRNWEKVKDPAGNVGWVPSEFLVAPGAQPTPSATRGSVRGGVPRIMDGESVGLAAET